MKTRSDGSDYDIYKDGLKIYTIDSRMQLHAEGCFCSHGKSSGRIFYSGKRIKRSICGISDKETQRILTNAMKASNRWSV
jgi:penicillin-binding protein 1A